jgi:hypothetical protein
VLTLRRIGEDRRDDQCKLIFRSGVTADGLARPGFRDIRIGLRSPKPGTPSNSSNSGNSTKTRAPCGLPAGGATGRNSTVPNGVRNTGLLIEIVPLA